MRFDRDNVAAQLGHLADRAGIFLGTSSWKFPGWCGVLYDESHYFWGTHFSNARFGRDCLAEYAEVFRTVGVDATYYRLHRQSFFDGLAAQVPDGFRFSFKVPDEITIKNFPDHKNFGTRRGQRNDHFLSAGVFEMGFLRRLAPIREKVGMLVFEFSHFHPDDFAHGRDFVAALDRFFGSLTEEGWAMGVEVRNTNLLHPEYFDMLASHGVAHIYNQWTQMPPVTDQMALHPLGSGAFLAARLLLSPGMGQDYAESEFAPFNQGREIDPAAREALHALVTHQLAARAANPETPPAFLYVGNRLEGNALRTIGEILANAEIPTPQQRPQPQQPRARCQNGSPEPVSAGR